MITQKPLYCSICGYQYGYEEDYMFYVVTTDILCPRCGEVVIKADQVLY